MTTAEWMALHDDDSILRDYFWRTTGAFSKNLDTRRDLYQEAWLRMGESAGQKTIEYYMHQGFKAIRNYYLKEVRENRLVWYGPGKYVGSATYQRVRRILIKIIQQ